MVIYVTAPVCGTYATICSQFNELSPIVECILHRQILANFAKTCKNYQEYKIFLYLCTLNLKG